jgi:hypothetical protein
MEGRTRALLPAFFGSLAENVPVTEFTPLSFTANDTDVMCVVRFGMASKATGRRSTANNHQVAVPRWQGLLLPGD